MNNTVLSLLLNIGKPECNFYSRVEAGNLWVKRLVNYCRKVRLRLE